MSSSRAQQLQTDVYYWQEEIRQLNSKQQRIMDESREISRKIEDAQKTLQKRQEEVRQAMEEESRNPKH
ncbi:MAG: hypothetical protein UY01_C0013G0002 [Candidatus Nomurabacteria bacterium GW2011_GWB1_47_6]|uniref:Uncharacterized protein n=1 Tax=Candidatus Nomurabacteria bacterium GW2011_GWB1_47_6 TaxID=1618749 RepID=A0A0G1T0Z5_9BACT|nr:MAG: hypothetical protein UY01_C0013G0002 [Candidatus Nomurabacteria bacterium GW2011_GWB1_47_6]